MKESDFEQFCEMVPQLISDVSKMMSYRNKVYRNVTEVMDDKMMEKTVIVLKDLKMAIRRVERIASKFKEMSGSDTNSSVNVSTKIESTPSRKRAPPSDDENNKSSSVKQKVKKKRLDTGTPVRQKSKTDVSKDIPKIKKIIEKKKWDFSPLDPNEWEFENGEFICIFCGTDQQTIEKMESHFIMPPNCCEKFDKIESLFETDEAISNTSISAEKKEPVLTQPALESILESEDEKTDKKESKSSPEEKSSPDEENFSYVNEEDNTIEKPNNDSEDLVTIEKEISKDEKPEISAETEVSEAKNAKIETPEKAPEKTPLENIPEYDQKTENKTDNMNSKPNETDISNADNPPPQTDDLKTDNPPVDDPQEDDPVASIDSSVDSSEAFKCRHCEVDPFQNETELKEHIKLKHEIKCKFCDSTFPSRGYMMTHQRNDHPVELKALQERRKSKKAQKAAS